LRTHRATAADKISVTLYSREHNNPTNFMTVTKGTNNLGDTYDTSKDHSNNNVDDATPTTITNHNDSNNNNDNYDKNDQKHFRRQKKIMKHQSTDRPQ